MKIGIDGRILENDITGVGNYVLELLDGLTRKDMSVVVFCSKTPKVITKRVKIKILESCNCYNFEQVLLPYYLKKEKVDIFHAPANFGIPIFCPVPSILTIHDIIPILIKGYFSSSKHPLFSKYSYSLRLRSSIFKAKKIISVSSFTKNSILKKISVNENKIVIIEEGINDTLNYLPGGKNYGKYIINNGGIDKRKNLDILIKAYKKVKDKFPGINLVITGENHKLRQELDILVKNLKLERSIYFTGYVKKERLMHLLKKSECLCFPSQIEGFGFPILEAFKTETPVVTSNNSSLGEIGNGAAILVDPNNIEEISQGMIKVISNKNLRKELIKSGLKKLNQYSWAETIKKTLELYEEVNKKN